MSELTWRKVLSMKNRVMLTAKLTGKEKDAERFYQRMQNALEGRTYANARNSNRSGRRPVDTLTDWQSIAWAFKPQFPGTTRDKMRDIREKFHQEIKAQKRAANKRKRKYVHPTRQKTKECGTDTWLFNNPRRLQVAEIDYDKWAMKVSGEPDRYRTWIYQPSSPTNSSFCYVWTEWENGKLKLKIQNIKEGETT